MASNERLPLFENARGLLILLVAMGHALEPLLSRDAAARGVYSAIYLFHIPAFAFLSGHLSSTKLDRRGLESLATTIVLPLLLFQVLYVSFDVWILGHAFKWSWLYTPYWILWFLLSLLFWRLLLPVVRGAPGALSISVALCVVSGALPFIGYPLSLSRTLVFLPFFVAGSLMPRELLTRPPTGWVRVGAGAVMFGIIGWAALIAAGVTRAPNPQWLYGSSTFAALGVSFTEGALIRLGQLTAALVATLALVAVCPRGRSALTTFGGASLAPFLLHGFVLRAADSEGYFASVSVLPAMLSGAVLALLLGWAPIVRVTQPLWNPVRFARDRVLQRPRP